MYSYTYRKQDDDFDTFPILALKDLLLNLPEEMLKQQADESEPEEEEEEEEELFLDYRIKDFLR